MGDNNNLRNYAVLSGIAVQMCATIYAFGYGGIWLDEKYGTDPTFKAVGVLVGVAVAITVVLLQLKRLNKNQ